VSEVVTRWLRNINPPPLLPFNEPQQQHHHHHHESIKNSWASVLPYYSNDLKIEERATRDISTGPGALYHLFTFTWPYQQQSTHNTLERYKLCLSTELYCQHNQGGGEITPTSPPSFQEPTQNAARTICNIVLELKNLGANRVACLAARMVPTSWYVEACSLCSTINRKLSLITLYQFQNLKNLFLSRNRILGFESMLGDRIISCPVVLVNFLSLSR
jgi:hypothetical protein